MKSQNWWQWFCEGMLGENYVPFFCSPINSLTVTPNRVVYVIIFGAMSGDIFTHLFDYENFLPTSSQPYLKPLIKDGKQTITVGLLSPSHMAWVYKCEV